MQQRPSQTFSFFDSVAMVVGIVVGAGIFQFPALVAQNMASGLWLAAAWAAGGVVSLVGVLCYAELACAHPDAGGDYHFLFRGLGRPIAFVFAWTRMTVIQPGSIAMLAFVAGQTLSRHLPLGAASDAVWAAIVVVVLTALNVLGVRNSNTMQKMLTGAILAGLLAVFLLGVFAAPGAPAPASAGMPPRQTLAGFGMAMVFVLLTFGGWNEAAYISAEIRGPRRTIVYAMLAGIGVVTAIYLLVNFALHRALGLEGMRAFSAYHDLVDRTVGHGGAVVSLLILAATLSTMNATIATGARGNYAFGRDFRIAPFLGRWDERRGVPVAGLLFQAGVSLALVVFGAFTKKLQAMVDYTSPAFWFFFLLTGISLFALRHREPDHPRPFRVPLYPVPPVLFVLFCGFMLYSSLNYTGRGAWFGVAVMAVGALFWAVETRKSSTRHEEI